MELTTLAERARFARKRMGLHQGQAAKAIGCSRTTVTEWEKPGSRREISGRYLLRAAEVYAVSPKWLQLLQDDDEHAKRAGRIREPVPVYAYEIRGVDGEDGTDDATDRMVTVYDIEVSGGPGVIVPEYVETKYRLPFQVDWLRKWGAKPEDIKVAVVRGESMEPYLFHGDKVVFHTKRKRIVNDATFVLIYGDEARVKRLFTTPNGSLRIVSNNPDKSRFPDEIVSPDELDRVLILGQVIDRSGSGGLGL